MNSSLVLWAVGIAFAFTVWPIIGKFSGASGAWVGTIVVFASFITTVLLGAREIIISGPLLTMKAIVLLVFAGLANGAAVYYYSFKAADPTVPTGVFLLLVTVSMAVFAPIIDWFLNGSAISFKQCIGVMMVIAAIYLLKG